MSSLGRPVLFLAATFILCAFYNPNHRGHLVGNFATSAPLASTALLVLPPTPPLAAWSLHPRTTPDIIRESPPGAEDGGGVERGSL